MAARISKVRMLASLMPNSYQPQAPRILARKSMIGPPNMWSRFSNGRSARAGNDNGNAVIGHRKWGLTEYRFCKMILRISTLEIGFGPLERFSCPPKRAIARDGDADYIQLRMSVN
jgi:hypothetical protein